MKNSLVVWIGLLGGVAAYAQPAAGLGGISGVVRDATGAVVPGAKVAVVNEARGIRRNLETNEAGVFAAPALVPSAGYAVNVAKEGFAAFDAKEIELLVGQNINLNVVLQVAQTTLQIEVTGAVPIVEQTKTGVSQVVESAQIQNLPINGRRVDSFVLLAPAVVADGTFGLLSFRGIAGGNAFLTDGNDTTNQYYNENSGRTRISSQISQDAVQEFQVLSSGYSAEFGKASGGVINTVTRSGGNVMHGTGYWFFRNQDFGARDRYATTANPEETRHQLGGSVGGPIAKDKLFYFFNADLTRRKHPLVGLINRSTNPPMFASDGKFVGRSACTAAPAQCEAAAKFMERHSVTLDRRSDQEISFGKLDWRPREAHSISASFNYQRWISPNGIQTGAVVTSGSALSSNGDSTVRVRYGRLSWTAVSGSNKVNEFRFGWMKDRQFDDLPARFIPPETGAISISVQGIAVGIANYLPRLNPSENRYQVADNLAWTIGRHTVKFGFDLANTYDFVDNLFNRFGSYSYSTFSAFAQDFSGNTGGKRWQTYSQAFGNPQVSFTIRDYALYIQDQFRATAGLTLNYGLRYETYQVTQPTLSNPDYPQTRSIPTPGKNFGPRIGAAYAFPNGKTVLRAGYGIFHARLQGGLAGTFHLQNGIYQKSISLNSSVPADLAVGPVFPNRLAGTDRNPPAGTVDLVFAANDFRTPYTQQGDFAIEHELTKNLGATVSYVWSRGMHLTTVRDLNIGPLGAPVTYSIANDAGAIVGTYTTPTYRLANRVDPRYRRVKLVDAGANSYYNALVAQLRKRLSKGVEGSLAYTWAHAIDFNQGGGSDNIFFSGNPGSLFNGDYRGDKSSSSLDQRHRLAATTILSPRFMKSDSEVAKYLVNNWQLSQITVLATGFPATPTIFVSGSPFSGAAFTGTLNGFGGSSRVPFIPAASLKTDRIFRTDARLSKILPFTERYQLYVNFEAFNVFNHVSDTGVNNQAFTASGGVLRPTPRLGEGNQSAGFPDGTNARRAQVSLRLVF